jgi:uncharacterized protein YqjF (DUF2071 family)
MEAISALAQTRIVRPAMRQAWRDLTFLHWRFPPEAVRPLVPPQLELDLWEGAAWVGLVPFAIEGLTHPAVPAVPWLSHFLETNVRTYVVDPQGRRGVWFFSLDAARLPAVIGARAAFALPYFWARMSLQREGAALRYRSRRIAPGQPASDLAIQVGTTIHSPGEHELFLTARFRLFAARMGTLLHADIAHSPWPLQQAHAVYVRQNLIEAAGLPSPLGEPLAHFSRRIEVLVGWPVRHRNIREPAL